MLAFLLGQACYASVMLSRFLVTRLLCARHYDACITDSDTRTTGLVLSAQAALTTEAGVVSPITHEHRRANMAMLNTVERITANLDTAEASEQAGDLAIAHRMAVLAWDGAWHLTYGGNYGPIDPKHSELLNRAMRVTDRIEEALNVALGRPSYAGQDYSD